MPTTSAPALTLLSGANHTYFRCLWQFLKSVLRSPEAPSYHLRIYDLGLLLEQKRQLQRSFAAYPQIEWRTFAFERYPAYFRPEALTYAWKPVLIAEACEELQGHLLWLDSATLVLGSLQPVRAWLEAHGVYVPFSSGAADCTLQAWTHPATLACLNVAPTLFNKRQRAGGVCGFNYQHPAVRDLVQAWRQCAFRLACLAPAGATVESHHRFDESVLTALLYQYEQRQGLTLTADELNLNSRRPVPFLSAGHKVWNNVPRGLDFAVWRYFWFRRLTYIFWNRLTAVSRPLSRVQKADENVSADK